MESTNWSIVMFVILSYRFLSCLIISHSETPSGLDADRRIHIVCQIESSPSSLGCGEWYNTIFLAGTHNTYRSFSLDSKHPIVMMSCRFLSPSFFSFSPSSSYSTFADFP